MTIALGTLLAVSIIWVIYMSLVRPVWVESMRFEMRKIENELILARIEQHAGSKTEVFDDLYSSQKIFSSVLPYVSISPLLLISMTRKVESEAEAKKDAKMYSEAPLWIRELKNRQSLLMLQATVANSPIYFPALPFAALAFALFVGWRARFSIIEGAGELYARDINDSRRDMLAH